MGTDNKLIADFMGVTYDIYEDVVCKYGVTVKGAQYHASWDWLMPVVEKIETMPDIDFEYYIVKPKTKSMQWCIEIGKDGYTVIDGGVESLISKIDAHYKAVVEFIKWYNNQAK